MNDGETKLSRLSEFKLDCRRSIENRKFTLMTLAFILPTSLLWLVALPFHIYSVLQLAAHLSLEIIMHWDFCCSQLSPRFY